jgi:hypothetical protein
MLESLCQFIKKSVSAWISVRKVFGLAFLDLCDLFSDMFNARIELVMKVSLDLRLLLVFECVTKEAEVITQVV